MKQRSHHIHRNYFVLSICIGILLLLVSYRHKITYTTDLYNTLQDKKRQATLSEHPEIKLQELKKQTTEYIGKKSSLLNKNQIQQNLFTMLTSFSENRAANLIGISDATILHFQNHEVYAFDISLSGRFIDLLQILRSLEKNDQNYRLASVKFQSQKNHQTKKKQLNTYIHVQYIQ